MTLASDLADIRARVTQFKGFRGKAKSAWKPSVRTLSIRPRHQ